jgi:hypothetical protein
MARSQKNRKQSNKTRKYMGGNHLPEAAIKNIIARTFEGMNASEEEEEKAAKLLHKILPTLTFEEGYRDCNGRRSHDLIDQAVLKSRCWFEDALDKSNGGEFKIQSRYFGKTGPERNINNPAAKAHEKKYGRMLRSNPNRPRSPDLPPSPGQEESVKSKSKSKNPTPIEEPVHVEEPVHSASRSASAKAKSPSPKKTKKRGFLSSIFGFGRK